MPHPKATTIAMREHIAGVREQMILTLSSLEPAAHDAKSDLCIAQQQIMALESALEEKTVECSKISASLLKAKKISEELFLDLESERNRYNGLYKHLRAERQACQRCDAWKSTLENDV